MTLTYRVLRAIVTFLFRALCRFEVMGLENVPASGPVLLVLNHIHMLDAPAAMVAMPRQIKLLAARKWSRHPVGLLLRAVGAAFINRGEVDRRALRYALQALEEGHVFGIAPEGTRSKTHQLQAARGGVAFLAYHSGAPLLPAAVTGVEHAIPALLRLRRATVRVTIGKPFMLPALDHKPRSEELLELADGVMRHVAELLPPEYRGVYGGGGGPLQRSPAPQG
ncbi:MAG TPA: lysophospholipid acyltransferase family protein [Anaerolineae bacterium]|nr:lysophospholipid acyltransferase family protein [Anaerolineae bacterium]HOR00310.1 lysophospholipid acyltransferase family protein [Anaerolineae bacterium]HPL28600.1 lysophospholipid acyltransferase family protein [Anaerolineae bacterium]